jgi:hypothetical protein
MSGKYKINMKTEENKINQEERKRKRTENEKQDVDCK